MLKTKNFLKTFSVAAVAVIFALLLSGCGGGMQPDGDNPGGGPPPSPVPPGSVLNLRAQPQSWDRIMITWDANTSVPGGAAT